MADPTASEFLILGGGLAGSVIAAQLAAARPTSSITILEAGNDESSNPLCVAPLASFGAHHSPLDWAYTTAPQKHLDGRRCYAAAGKALGGSTAINYGTWTRGARADYDAWVDMAGDSRWGYDGLLGYFRRTERHSGVANGEEHGDDGPIWTTSVSASSKDRIYGLRTAVAEAWTRAGVRHIDDSNAGHPAGFAEVVENWRDGRRQLASDAYDLKAHGNISVVTGQLVQRVVFSVSEDGEVIATGAETNNGTIYYASKEVIVTCGAYRSPQLLLLSGIGPAAELARHGIKQHAELPVGLNFHDHASLNQFWKLSQPERGLSIGSPLWADEPAYQLGLPCDWIAWTSGPSGETLATAQRADEKQHDTASTATIADVKQRAWERAVTSTSGSEEDRTRIETIIAYAPAGASIQHVQVPLDGTYITTATIGMLPTSRGTISLASADAADAPVIDPNYYATEADRVVLRSGVRLAMKVVNSMKNPDGSPAVVEETTREGIPVLGPSPSDEDIDERMKTSLQTFYHVGGGCALGSVVDGECRVKGVKSLRVADASVMPVPISAHYQVAVYAIAGQVADMIIDAY